MKRALKVLAILFTLAIIANIVVNINPDLRYWMRSHTHGLLEAFEGRKPPAPRRHIDKEHCLFEQEQARKVYGPNAQFGSCDQEHMKGWTEQ